MPGIGKAAWNELSQINLVEIRPICESILWALILEEANRISSFGSSDYYYISNIQNDYGTQKPKYLLQKSFNSS